MNRQIAADEFVEEVRRIAADAERASYEGDVKTLSRLDTRLFVALERYDERTKARLYNPSNLRC